MADETVNKIVLFEDLSNQLFSLCMNKEGADVEFVVENERIPAHRIILATRCQYFRSLLFNGLFETFERDVSLPVKSKPFKAILIYLYTGQLHFSFGDGEYASIYDVLELAHEYMMENLTSSISEILSTHVNLENVCDSMNTATTYELEKLLNACLKFIDGNALDILKHDSTNRLTQESLIKLIKCDNLSVEEIDVFRMVLRWRENNSIKDISPILENVRFSLMSFEELVTEVQDSGMLGPQMLVNIFTEKTVSSKLPLRILYSKPFPCFYETNSSQHIIGTILTFKMSKMSLINTIKIYFKNVGSGKCYNDDPDNFVVNTSPNNQDWICIAKGYISGPFPKTLKFKPTEVLYVCVKSTDSSEDIFNNCHIFEERPTPLPTAHPTAQQQSNLISSWILAVYLRRCKNKITTSVQIVDLTSRLADSLTRAFNFAPTIDWT